MIQLKITQEEMEGLIETLTQAQEDGVLGIGAELETSMKRSGTHLHIEIICDECLGEGEVEFPTFENGVQTGIGTQKCICKSN